MAAVSSGNMARKTLADISNFPVQQLVRDGKSHSTTTTKDYERLLKEKMQLMKILADRQKIIEVTGIELQKLRINQQKMQEQNKLLAQSNRQLLAEINANSEKVKALNHDLGCKNGLLKALQHELKSQVKVNVSEEEVKLTGIEDQEVVARGQNADKQDTSNRRIYSNSRGPSLQVQSKEKAGNKRACVRRQSARFKSEEAESSGYSCGIPETKLMVCPPLNDSGLEDGVASMVTTVKDEDKEGNVATSFCMDEEEVKFLEIHVPGELATKRQDAGKQDTFNRRNQSKSLVPSRQALSKEKAGKKRACVRRQCARFKSEEVEDTDELCQIPETKFAVCPLPTDSVLEDSEVSRLIMMKDEDKEGNSTISHEQGRPSIGRPSEVAAKKVQSYKEISLRDRASVRRRSARLKSEEAESSRYFTGIPETKLMVCLPPTASDLEDGVASTVTTMKDEDKEGNAAISFCVNEDEVKLTETELSGELATTEQDADKQGTSTRRNQSKSLGSFRQFQSKEKAGNKRACVRRQSASLKSEETEFTDELCEIPETQFAVCLPPTETVLEDGVATILTKVKNDKEGNAAIRHEQGRPSIGRPSRAAANKVQSYKEIPLKVKMRRPD